MILLQIARIIDPIASKLDSWFDASVSFIPNVVMALLVLLIFRFLASYISRVVANLLGKASHNIALVGLISALTKIIIFAAGLFLLWEYWGLRKPLLLWLRELAYLH